MSYREKNNRETCNSSIKSSSEPIIKKKHVRPQITTRSQKTRKQFKKLSRPNLISIPISLGKNSESKNFVVPEISGAYDHTYNIIYLDHCIRKKIKSEYESVQDIREKIITLQEELKLQQTMNEYKNRLHKIEEYENEIKDKSNKQKLLDYEEEAGPLISAYKRLRLENLNDEDIKEEITQVIKLFINLGSKYIKLNLVHREYNTNQRCVGCGIDLSEYSNTNISSIICPECDAINPCHTEDKMDNTSVNKRINTGTRNDYEDQQNFRKFLMSFQGITSVNISDGLIAELDRYFSNIKFTPREQIRQMEYSNSICRGNSNHSLLFSALSSIGRSDLNSSVNLVGHVYWDWKLPDINRHIEKIMSHYRETQAIFYVIPNKKRQSSIGRPWRAYKHMQLLGLPYTIDMFKTSNMEESVNERIMLWKIMCQQSNNPEIYYMDD